MAFVNSRPGVPYRPPRLPISAVALAEPSTVRSKRQPPALSLAGQQSATETQSFSMSTPRNSAKMDQSRHYIGTPRAESILSAFLDFDDAELEDAGPPLDFDDAMAALEAQSKLSADSNECGSALLRDECDCSESTQCSSNSAVDNGSSGCIEADNDTDQEEDEEEYEDDFESDSEYSDEEVDSEVVRKQGANTMAIGIQIADGASQHLRSSRGRSSSRVKRTRAPSNGAARHDSRCPSSGAARRSRGQSLPRALPPGMPASLLHDVEKS